MKTQLIAILMGLAVSLHSHAGDLATGSVRYSANFSVNFQRYELTEANKAWISSLVQNLDYSGDIVHFLRTDLVLYRRGEPVQGSIYQALEAPSKFYVLEGDVMLDLDGGVMTSPGTGGFSLHAPEPKNFIICLNCHPGVPYSYFSHFNLGFANAWWWAGDFRRL